MTHHWRASDQLEPSLSPGEWRMCDGGRLVGVITLGRVNGKPGLRGANSFGEVLGYAWTLEDACDRLWGWYELHRTRLAGEGVSVGFTDVSQKDPTGSAPDVTGVLGVATDG